MPPPSMLTSGRKNASSSAIPCQQNYHHLFSICSRLVEPKLLLLRHENNALKAVASQERVKLTIKANRAPLGDQPASAPSEPDPSKRRVNVDATTSFASDSSPPPLTAHLTGGTAHTDAKGPLSDHHVDFQTISLGREKVHWSAEVWKRIDHAVAHETHRASVGPKVLPHFRTQHHITNVEADVVVQNLQPNAPRFIPPQVGAVAPFLLNVQEAQQLPLIELSVTFALSQAQLRKESELRTGPETPHDDGHHAPSLHDAQAGHSGQAHDTRHHHHHSSSTAVMLARRATNVLCLARDTLIFQGTNALPPAGGGAGGLPLFTSQLVSVRGAPTDAGLTGIGGSAPLPAAQVIPVHIGNAGGANAPAQYGPNTVTAITSACSTLVSTGYMGPLACVLYFFDYADAFSPLVNTLILPADRIAPLLQAGFHNSGTMPGIPNPQNNIIAGAPPPLNLTGLLNVNNLVNQNAQAVGLVMSLGGNTVEFVNGLDPVTAFSYIDPSGNYIFRVFTRFATKISDQGAIMRLEFD
jgi:hypothetical protein